MGPGYNLSFSTSTPSRRSAHWERTQSLAASQMTASNCCENEFLNSFSNQCHFVTQETAELNLLVGCGRQPSVQRGPGWRVWGRTMALRNRRVGGFGAKSHKGGPLGVGAGGRYGFLTRVKQARRELLAPWASAGPGQRPSHHREGVCLCPNCPRPPTPPPNPPSRPAGPEPNPVLSAKGSRQS